MSQGRVVEYGTAAQVFGAPQHAYTQSLFAAAPGREFKFGIEKFGTEAPGTAHSCLPAPASCANS